MNTEKVVASSPIASVPVSDPLLADAMCDMIMGAFEDPQLAEDVHQSFLNND